MNLAEWCRQADVLPTHPTTERQAVSLYATEKTPNFTKLWNLDDYRVDSRFGPVVWLVPKAPEPAPFNPDYRPGFKEALEKAYVEFDEANPHATRADRMLAHHQIVERLKPLFPKVD